MALFTFHQAIGLVLVILGSTTLPRTSQALPRLLLVDEAAEKWVSSHGKVYKDSAEKEKRLKVLKKNLEFIDKFNGQSNRSFALKANAFADLTNQEFHQITTGGFKMTNLTRSLTSATMSLPSEYRIQGLDAGSSSPPPSTVDWRASNALNPIREQLQCASCWAFATVAAVESATYIKTGKLPSLSEQQLVDCVIGDYTHGCSGGNPDEAFTYITKNGGVASESSYPYTAKTGTCTGSQHSAAATIAGYVDVPHNNEAALKSAVSQQPVVAFLDSSGETFQFYAGGVYDAQCGTTLDHLVAVIGYGATEDGVPYWLLRNSWGAGWGEAGYMRLRMNAGPAEGLCGIAMFPSYPTV